jgi:thermitase
MNAPRILISFLALLAAGLFWMYWKNNRVGNLPPKPDERKIQQTSLPRVTDPLINKGPLPAEAGAQAASSDLAIPGEVVIRFRDAEALESFVSAARERGVQVLAVLPELLAVRIGGASGDVQPLLGDDALVSNNYRVRIPDVPDPEFWQNANSSPLGSGVLDFLGISDSADWPNFGEGVTIAIIDTGWSGHTAVPSESVRQLELFPVSMEGQFSAHGTAVAGLIASVDPYAPGIAPGSQILSIPVLDGNGEGDAFSLAAGIVAAVDQGADVINMSLGSYGDSEVLRQAVAYAAAQGVVMVAASGNDGRNLVTYPAAYESVIAVAAVDAEGNRAAFSNYGEEIDLAAPGVKVHALWEGDAFVYFDGTSASAPLVAGMAARILQSGTAATAEEVRQVLLDTANETGLPGDDVQYGAGILNAARIESAGQSGIIDVALADLYPALEQLDAGVFPLYVSLENRGTEFIPESSVELQVNGQPYFYRFSGLEPGGFASIQFPVQQDYLISGQVFAVSAKVGLPAGYEDSLPLNDEGNITLSFTPVD